MDTITKFLQAICDYSHCERGEEKANPALTLCTYKLDMTHSHSQNNKYFYALVWDTIQLYSTCLKSFHFAEVNLYSTKRSCICIHYNIV